MHPILSENQYSTPLLKITTGVQNPSELAAIVSFREYSRELVGVGEVGEELKLVGG